MHSEKHPEDLGRDRKEFPENEIYSWDIKDERELSQMDGGGKNMPRRRTGCRKYPKNMVEGMQHSSQHSSMAEVGRM